jgi:hypothetical protein
VGTIETGAYGFDRELVNKSTGKTVYRRKAVDAEMMPFYFCISMPLRTISGWLLFDVSPSMLVSAAIESHKLVLGDSHGIPAEVEPIVVVDRS